MDDVRRSWWCSEVKRAHYPAILLNRWGLCLLNYRRVPLVVTHEGLYPETQVALKRKGAGRSLLLGISITNQASNPFFKLTEATTVNTLPCTRS